ncbi:MAG: hypothetical protein JNL57_09955 [Bacteroidetes bacterium]|nr:hypothetical protein [Bacteroidota bacterium]
MKIIYLLSVLGLFQELTAQNTSFCVELDVPRNQILVQDKFIASLRVNPFPENAQLRAFVNGTPLPVKGNTASYSAIASAPGEYRSQLKIQVYLSDSVAFQQERVLRYTVYMPMVQTEVGEGAVLYAGLWTPVQIYAPGIEPTNMSVDFRQAAVRMKSAGNFLIQPDSSANTVQAMFSAQIQDRKVSLGTKTWKIIPLPAAQVFLRTFMDTSRKKHLMPEIRIAPVPGLSNRKLQVQSWRLSVYSGDKWFNTVGTGPVLDMEAMKLVSQLLPGDRVLLENVVVSIPGEENAVLHGNFQMIW